MDTYLESKIAYEDVNKFGVYNESTDDIDLTFCPQNCGRPLISHLYNDLCPYELKDEEFRKYADLNKNESAKLIDVIKEHTKLE